MKEDQYIVYSRCYRHFSQFGGANGFRCRRGSFRHVTLPLLSFMCKVSLTAIQMVGTTVQMICQQTRIPKLSIILHKRCIQMEARMYGAQLNDDGMKWGLASLA